MFKRINKLITKEGFGLRSWDDRYSKGVWVCVAPNYLHLEEAESVSGAGDLDMIPATEYLLSTDWLPIVIGDSFTDGLEVLEKRLENLPGKEINRSSIWSLAVTEALDHLVEISKSNMRYGGMDGKLICLAYHLKQINEP